MKKLKFSIIIGLILLIASTVSLYTLLQSHKTFENALKNNLPTEQLRTPYLYDIVIILFLGLIGFTSLIFLIAKIYKLKKTQYNNMYS